MTYEILDAAYPPRVVPAGIDGVMGYLGGPNAARIWTLDEWLPFAAVRQFPVYVANVNSDPHLQGTQAAQLALSLGWSDKMTGAEQRAIIVDLELAADRVWYAAAADVISSHGFTPVAYGSMSTILGNAASDVLVADWNDAVVVPAGQTIHGIQSRANIKLGTTVVDYSDFDDWLFRRGGVGPRHGVAQ